MNPQTFIEKLLNSNNSLIYSKTISKGDFLIKEGEIEKNIYFIESGAVRAFYLSEFEEQTIRLGYKDSIITSLSSFITGQPSEMFIEAIRKTKVKVIPREVLLDLIYESPENMKQYIQLLELQITQQIDREIDILIPSPTERLNRVLKRSPNVFQHVPLKYIASYLRMKPETLSRIRNS